MKYSILLLLVGSLSAQDNPKVIPPMPQHFEYVLQGKQCNNSPIVIGPGEHFRCVGKDKEHLICSDIPITVRGQLDNCLQINVVRDGSKKKNRVTP